ncbi:hypothetical protein O0L34_g17761 [Tuta absoluta]|nr:hypothetical protein O0L34_g17761 [Tuta absoluta]
MLVWLFVFHQVTARDIPLQTSYVTKYIQKCPDEGYFFKRDLQVANSDICYLCFCKDNATAICWQRNNKKCDAESYQHIWKKKRVSRNRRSLMDFSNLFIKDAVKDVFHARSQKTCKPNEASYSEGCPPVDWCVGCTVCDCNSQGKWDCHLLSFCSDDGQ